MTFKEWKKDLLKRAAKFDRPAKARRIIPEIVWVNGSVQVAHVNQELLLWCHCCGEGANTTLVRLSFSPGMTSIVYVTCDRCRDSRQSERIIEREMRRAWILGARDSNEEFQSLCDEAVLQYARGKGQWKT